MEKARCFITTTISPMMIGHTSLEMEIIELPQENMEFSLLAIDSMAKSRTIEFHGAVSHEITARVLEPIVKEFIPEISDIKLFNRVNIKLGLWDSVLAIIPNFRASEAREFTLEEVQNAGFRVFHARMRQHKPAGLEAAIKHFK